MQEIWESAGKLINKQEWGQKITSLHSETQFSNKEEAKRELREKLLSAVRRRIQPKKVGIFFSGGVDSTFIASACKILKADFTCFTVGFQDQETKEPEDITEAKKAAKALGFELKYKIFNLAEAQEIIKKTVSILKKEEKVDVVNVGVGAVVVAAAEVGKKNNITYFLGGLGSEEIFAGYERHSQADDINEECWRGLKYMWERDLVRDTIIAQELGITLGTPFLDAELIKLAMTFPGEWKIKGDVKKLILREATEEFLGEFAWRKKRAAQYGSCFDKAIDKLARKNGFKMKKEWLESL